MQNRIIDFRSTIYILTEEDRKTAISLTELHNPQNGEKLQMGYLQSKWVSERLALAGRDRKIPVSIYRVGRIGGDTQMGACQKSDFYWGHFYLALTVDIVSRSIVNLAMSLNNQNDTYHLLNSEKLSASTLIANIRNKGYSLEVCSFDEWKRAIFIHMQKNPGDPAAILAGFLSDRWNEKEPIFSSCLTQQKIEELEITVPNCGSSWIQKTINFFIQNKFFPPNESSSLNKEEV